LKKANKKLSQADIALYQTRLNETFNILKNLKGEKLLAALSERMNLDHYMRWLAVNYLIQNGDYSDEVFFFGVKDAQGQIKFDIMPWDMDDSFQKRMHLAFIPGEFNAGQEARSQRQMLYSFESQLDQAISQDSVLLKKYFETLDQVTQELSAQKITAIVDQVMAELYPYLNDSDILAAGALDESKAPHDADAVFKDAALKQETLKSRLAMMQKEIQVIKSENIDRAEAINHIEQKMGHFILKVTAHFAKPNSK
jgi:spore coat protein CotH